MNAPHDCITHSCEIDGTAGFESEEREPTGFSKPAVVHNHPNTGDIFILNTHISHCRGRLEHLYPPIPRAQTVSQIATLAIKHSTVNAALDDSSEDEPQQEERPVSSIY